MMQPAQGLQLAQEELIPIAMVRLDVVGECRCSDPAFL
jgi:hypothetical protein